MISFNVYSVFDSKADVFSQPQCYENDATAMRSFSVGVNDRDSKLFWAPEDFTLFRIGSWDNTNGKLTGEDKVAIVNGAQVKKIEEVK